MILGVCGTPIGEATVFRPIPLYQRPPDGFPAMSVLIRTILLPA
jgi:hypothetical protein